MADKLPETMSQEDPWAWLAWAQQREPETYGWDTIKGASDPFSAGPAWWAGNVADGADPHATMTPEQAQAMADAGYQWRQARGPGYTNLWQVIDPNGKVVDQGGFDKTQSLHGKDYAMFASVIAAGLGGAAYGAGAGGASGAGAAAAEGAAAGSGAAGTAAAGTNWGAIGSAAAKSAALNGGLTAVRGGDLGDVLKSAAVGGVTGAAGGAISSLGYSPVVSQAATGAIGAAARGGSGTDILTGAGVGALSGYVAGNGITGNSTVDRAITGAGTTAIRGGNASQIAQGAAGGALSDLTSGSRTSQTPAGPTYDVDLETPGINDNPGAAMSDPFDLSYGAVNDDLTFSTDVTGPNINDFPEDPGDGSFNPYDDPSRRADTVSNNGGNREPSGGWDFSKIFGSLFGNSPGQYSGGAFVSDMLKLFGAGMAGVASEKAQQDQRDWLERQAAEQRRRRMPGALAPMNVTVQRGGVNA